MPNPEFILCTKDAWTKVATSVVTGQLWKANSAPLYLQTYKLTGEAAPADRDEGMKLFAEADNEGITSNQLIDVYVFAVGFTGRVRVDV